MHQSLMKSKKRCDWPVCDISYGKGREELDLFIFIFPLLLCDFTHKIG